MIERDIRAEDRIELSSVGVDIGSATSHLVFSKVTVEKIGTRYVTVEREILYESPILLTPYDGPTSIDRDRLERFVEKQYEAAGMVREDVETGALILTGVALLRGNSRLIAEVFAQEAGKMVAVSAGDNMESVMAAHGSGAAARSEEVDGALLHIDIGGGTTKLAICSGGKVAETLALDVGARLIVVDDDGRIVRLEESGQQIGRRVGLDLTLGGTVSDDELEEIASYLASAVLAAAGISGYSGAELLRGDPLPPRPVKAVSFSGGVAEFIHGRCNDTFGDLGPFLAKHLRKRLATAEVEILDTGNSGIRATVVGASQHTVQVSGSTIHLSDSEILPLRNVQVVAPMFDFEELDVASIATALTKSLVQFDLTEATGPLGIAFRWDGLATFARIDTFARGVLEGLASLKNDEAAPIVLVSYEDVGRLIGSHISRELDTVRPVVSVDCVEVGDFGFVDIGGVIPHSGVVPVVIKTLLFPTAA